MQSVLTKKKAAYGTEQGKTFLFMLNLTSWCYEGYDRFSCNHL